MLSYVLSKWIVVQSLSGILGQITDAMLLQQDELQEEHLLTHIGAVTGQRGSRTLFTRSHAGKFLVTFGFGLWERNKYSHYDLNFLISCFSLTVFDPIV